MPHKVANGAPDATLNDTGRDLRSELVDTFAFAFNTALEVRTTRFYRRFKVVHKGLIVR